MPTLNDIDSDAWGWGTKREWIEIVFRENCFKYSERMLRQGIAFSNTRWKNGVLNSRSSCTICKKNFNLWLRIDRTGTISCVGYVYVNNRYNAPEIRICFQYLLFSFKLLLYCLTSLDSSTRLLYHYHLISI